MPTYYKYQNPAEIGAAPTLDWGTVIGNVNENLQKQEQQRYENREADKKLTNDILTKANEVSLTSDPNLNSLIVNASYDIKKNIFEKQKMVESGQISRSDFTITNQNTAASIAQLNQFTKTYGADYDKYLNDVKEGKTSAYADFMQKWKGGFQNFKDKKLINNPNDGRLYVAELDDKGNVKEGPLGMVPMSTLVEVKNFNDKKIDVLAETNRYAEQLKPFVKLVRSKGVETKEQLENFGEFNDFVNNVTEAIAKNEKGYASILTDTDGRYKITGEGASSGTNIGLKNNGAGEMVPIIDDTMKNRARDIVKEYLIAQTGIKETGTEVFAPREPRAPDGDKKTPPPPILGDVQNINTKYKTGKKETTGVVQSVRNVSFSGGKGIEHVVQKIGYEVDPVTKKGSLFLQGYTISGKESSEGFGDETSKNVVKRDVWGNVIPGKTKKDDVTGRQINAKTNKITSDRNGDIVSLYVKQIPNPSTGQLFNSLQEAEEYYSNTFRSNVSRTQGRTAAGNKQTNVGNEDQQAMNWLKANPNAPQAAAIRKTLKSKGLIK